MLPRNPRTISRDCLREQWVVVCIRLRWTSFLCPATCLDYSSYYQGKIGLGSCSRLVKCVISKVHGKVINNIFVPGRAASKPVFPNFCAPSIVVAFSSFSSLARLQQVLACWCSRTVLRYGDLAGAPLTALYHLWTYICTIAKYNVSFHFPRYDLPSALQRIFSPLPSPHWRYSYVLRACSSVSSAFESAREQAILHFSHWRLTLKTREVRAHQFFLH